MKQTVTATDEYSGSDYPTGGPNKMDRAGPKYIAHYTWDDDEYREFMIKLLLNLNPRYEPAGSVLFEELEEVNEMIFISKGQVDVGYSLNNEVKYVLRF